MENKVFVDVDLYDGAMKDIAKSTIKSGWFSKEQFEEAMDMIYAIALDLHKNGKLGSDGYRDVAYTINTWTFDDMVQDAL